MKRCQESEPALISAIFFISASPERSEIPWVESGKGKKTFSLFIFDKERSDHRGVVYIWSQRKS